MRETLTPAAARILRDVFAAAGVELARDAAGVARVVPAPVTFSGRVGNVVVTWGENQVPVSVPIRLKPRGACHGSSVLGNSRPPTFAGGDSSPAGTDRPDFFYEAHD
jgi:hypothetical protein